MKIFPTASRITLLGLVAVLQLPAMAAESKAPVDGVASITRVAPKADVREEIVSMPNSGGVNPMTGRSTKFEDMGQLLQEKVLEAKIAEQDFAIAKSRSDARKLAGDRTSVEAPPAPARLPDDVRVQAQKSAAKKATAAKRPAAGEAKRDQVAPVAAPYRAPERPRYVGRLEAGGELVAMVSYNGKTVAIKEGGFENGLSVSSISNSAAVINGVNVPFEKGVSTINLPETHQPVLPGATMGQVAPAPSRGVVVQGVNTAAVQPIAPGAPIPAAGTQPTRFPDNLYNR